MRVYVVKQEFLDDSFELYREKIKDYLKHKISSVDLEQVERIFNRLYKEITNAQ